MKTPEQIKIAISKLELTEQRYLMSVEKFVDDMPIAANVYTKKLRNVQHQILALKWVLDV